MGILFPDCLQEKHEAKVFWLPIEDREMTHHPNRPRPPSSSLFMAETADMVQGMAGGM